MLLVSLAKFATVALLLGNLPHCMQTLGQLLLHKWKLRGGAFKPCNEGVSGTQYEIVHNVIGELVFPLLPAAALVPASQVCHSWRKEASLSILWQDLAKANACALPKTTTPKANLKEALLKTTEFRRHMLSKKAKNEAKASSIRVFFPSFAEIVEKAYAQTLADLQSPVVLPMKVLGIILLPITFFVLVRFLQLPSMMGRGFRQEMEMLQRNLRHGEYHRSAACSPFMAMRLLVHDLVVVAAAYWCLLAVISLLGFPILTDLRRPLGHRRGFYPGCQLVVLLMHFAIIFACCWCFCPLGGSLLWSCTVFLGILCGFNFPLTLAFVGLRRGDFSKLQFITPFVPAVATY